MDFQRVRTIANLVGWSLTATLLFTQTRAVHTLRDEVQRLSEKLPESPAAAGDSEARSERANEGGDCAEAVRAQLDRLLEEQRLPPPRPGQLAAPADPDEREESADALQSARGIVAAALQAEHWTARDGEAITALRETLSPGDASTLDMLLASALNTQKLQVEDPTLMP